MGWIQTISIVVKNLDRTAEEAGWRIHFYTRPDKTKIHFRLKTHFRRKKMPTCLVSRTILRFLGLLLFSLRAANMSSRWNRTIYVGNLPGDIRMREVEDLFYKYGPIVDIDLKIPPRPPGYAFVEFEDPRDADDAIYGRDGYDFDGCRLRVEIAHGGRRGPSSSVDRYSSSYSGSRAPPRRSDYRVLVTGLPPSASWQDLKDHMRKAGDVCFSEVFRDRGGMSGVVDYSNYDDMKYAIRKLDDSEFRNAFSRAYIRVRDYESRSVSRSPYYSRSYRSRSRSRGRSYSYSSRSRSVTPARSVSPRSRSLSRTPYSSVSRSPSRSRSNSPVSPVRSD